MTSDFVRVASTESQEQAYQDVVDVLVRHCVAFPDATTSDILAILGKAAGYCVGLHLPERRERAREVVTTNLDMAAKEMAGENS